MRKILENPISFSPRRCRLCGKPGAMVSTSLEAPELGAGHAHFDCIKNYKAKKNEQENLDRVRREVS